MTSNAFDNVQKLNRLGSIIWRRSVSSYTDGSVDLTAIVNAIIAAVPASDFIELNIDVPGTFSGPVNFSRKGKYVFGPYQYDFTSTNAGVVIGPYKDVEICGQGQKSTTLKATAAVANLFFVSGYDPGKLDERRLYFHDMLWDGNQLGIKGYHGEDPSYPNHENLNFYHIFERLTINRWLEAGIETVRSEFQTVVRDCRFGSNGVGFLQGVYADAHIENCFFGQPRDTRGMLVVRGTQFRCISCSFTQGDDGVSPIGSGPDIHLQNPTNEGTGTMLFMGNYHGPESETAGRKKIVIGEAANPTFGFGECFFIGNWFYGIANQTAVQMLISCSRLMFDTTNTFNGFATIIDDNFTPGLTNVATEGGSVFRAAVVQNPAINPTTVLFTNGGRGFTDVVYPPEVTGYQAGTARLNNYGADQRLRQVIDWTTVTDSYSWGGSVTYTGGQTDPYGGATAALLTKPAATPSANAKKRIVLTDLVQDTGIAATTNNGRVCVDFWAKAGTLDEMLFSVYDDTNSRNIQSFVLSLTTAWKPFRFFIPGLNATGNIFLYFYPGIQGNSTTGTIYLANAQVSDVGADFTTTPTYP
jgi:hypothetical protein